MRLKQCSERLYACDSSIKSFQIEHNRIDVNGRSFKSCRVKDAFMDCSIERL